MLNPIPIAARIPTRRYVNYVHDEGKQSLFSYISTIFKNVELSNDQFLIKLERNLLNGKAIIFLDGLDAMELEAPNSINIVERFIEEYPECAFIISSKNKSILSSKGFNEYELQEFNTEESKEFVEKWFNYSGGTSFLKETKKSLIKMITEGEIKEFFSIPLYISLICIILSSENKENKNADIQQVLSNKNNKNEYEFILQELILINKATLKLLEPDPHESNFEKNYELDKIYENISSFVKARLLSHIAIEMMKQGNKVYIKFNELISYTTKFLFYIPEAEEKEEFRLCSKNILLAIELYDGLLVRRIIGNSNEYSFIHIKIRIFFAALYISFASHEEQKEIWEEYVSISTDDSKNSKETNKENWKNIFLHAKIMLKWRENQIQEQQDKLNQLIKKELLESVLVSKFSKLTRQEIEAMFLVSDIKQTRVYQEAKQEGETNLLVRQLSKRFGKLTHSYIENINKLTIAQLEDLGEALLDFVNINDLEQWLKAHMEL